MGIKDAFPKLINRGHFFPVYVLANASLVIPDEL